MPFPHPPFPWPARNAESGPDGPRWPLRSCRLKFPGRPRRRRVPAGGRRGGGGQGGASPVPGTAGPPPRPARRSLTRLLNTRNPPRGPPGATPSPGQPNRIVSARCGGCERSRHQPPVPRSGANRIDTIPARWCGAGRGRPAPPATAAGAPALGAPLRPARRGGQGGRKKEGGKKRKEKKPPKTKKAAGGG